MPFGFFMDKWYLLLVVPALLVAAWAQYKVHATFKKYSQVGTQRGLTGAQASELILQREGVAAAIEATGGSLTDHYDPRGNVIRLSEPVFGVSSIAAIGVAAHETGHALQYAKGYAPIQIRSAILPATRIGSTLAPYLVIAGLIFSFYPLAYAGIALFTLAVLFQLVTLPVEFNASGRALRVLDQQGYLSPEEMDGARAVLSAAAMTYVAAAISSLLQLVRLLIIARNRRD